VWPNTTLAVHRYWLGEERRGEGLSIKLDRLDKPPSMLGSEAKQGSHAGVCLRTRTVLCMLNG
jgi:hypothetical protein